MSQDKVFHVGGPAPACPAFLLTSSTSLGRQVPTFTHRLGTLLSHLLACLLPLRLEHAHRLCPANSYGAFRLLRHCFVQETFAGSLCTRLSGFSDPSTPPTSPPSPPPSSTLMVKALQYLWPPAQCPTLKSERTGSAFRGCVCAQARVVLVPRALQGAWQDLRL